MTFYNEDVTKVRGPIHQDSNTKGDKGKSCDVSRPKIVHPYLKKAEVLYVCKCIGEYYGI